MEFEEIKEKLAHHTPTIMGLDSFTKFAVFVPIMVIEKELHILFEVRSHELRRQPGEICFPGGRMDPTDRDAAHTALRETAEELGVCQTDIYDLAPLDYVITPYGTVIYPYVGLLEPKKSMQPNPGEVAEVFTVPLTYLLQTDPEVHRI